VDASGIVAAKEWLVEPFIDPGFLPLSPDVLPQPCPVPSFIKRARCEGHDSLRCIFFAGLEIETIKFEKKNANHKPSALVSIDEGMIPHYARGIEARHFEDVWRVGVGMVLARPRQSGLKKPLIAQPRSATMQRQQAIVDRENVARLDPDWLFVSPSHASLRQSMERIAVSAHDLFRLLHFLLERGIVRREPVIAVTGLDQKNLFAVAGAQTLNDFLGQHNAE
jgi:hypothetical protein